MKGGGDSTKYKHNQQLEELRNLQDRLTAEKSAWNTTRDQEAKELEEKKAELIKLQVRIYCVKCQVVFQRKMFCRNKLEPNKVILFNNVSNYTEKWKF